MSTENNMTRQLPPSQGVLELHSRGHGFLRNPARNYSAQAEDAFVPPALIQKFRLREGLLKSFSFRLGLRRFNRSRRL